MEEINKNSPPKRLYDYNKYLSGSVREKGTGGGAKWFATDINGQWTIVHIGNGLPKCSEVAQYNLPKEFLSCY